MFEDHRLDLLQPGAGLDAELLHEPPSDSPVGRQRLDLRLDMDDRVALLEQLLGKSLCRKLGVYRLPEKFLLSVVIPVALWWNLLS